MKLFACKLALVFLGLTIILSLCCAEKDQEADKPTTQEEIEPNTVAKIGDYTITKEELEEKLMTELSPNPYELRSETETPDAKAVLLKMIAEKAAVIEARKQNLHEDETVKAVIKKFKEKNLVNLSLTTHLQGKITITEPEIDEMIKSDPKLDRARAKAMLTRTKSGQLLGQYYNEIYKKFHVQKMSDNFSRAAQIHQRLLFQPKEPRKVGFIRISQIKNELTQEEQNIVLATYDNGKITLKDWFNALCEMSPPSRPRDLNTPKGVEQLLERALRMPIFVSDAKLLGFEKDENLLKQVKEYEDGILFNKNRRDKIKDVKGPIPDEQIVDYFNNNKEAFGTQNMLNIDQIWCQDLKTAQKAKAELDNGRDFEAIKQTYSLVKESSPYNTSLGSEGMFFKDLWNGEPNEVVGPVKGFHAGGVKWRIVKILEKIPGTLTEYSVKMKQQIEMKMLEKQRNIILEEYRKELLEKYPYEIYAERIRDIDPLDIP
ncbi:MAG: peptidylprolyl isomerase [Planctomycetota bacterium]|jgi:peptidyl-prolyl cis-trans isomerase C